MGILEKIPLRERKDLAIAWVAISAAFMMLFVRSGGFAPLTVLLYFILSLMTVGIAFVLHEMAHKFSAMHYGFWAEFKMDSGMLVVAVAMAALIGVVFAAPGATMIYGNNITRKENGVISAAGPLTNLVLLIPFGLIYLSGTTTGSWILVILGFIGLQVNAMIAAFNMLPVGNLDGSKIFAWDVRVFACMIILAFGSLAAILFYI